MGFIDQVTSLISIRPTRSINGFTAYVTINETTNDTLTITKQPVQQGASITDHSYKEPTTFSTSILFKDNSFNPLSQLSLAKIYHGLLNLQNLREPFDIVTPKRIYHNMLVSTLSMTTDKNTENVLAINANFQEVIIVNVATTTVPRANQKNPGATGATQKAGVKQSGLYTGAQAVGLR